MILFPAQSILFFWQSRQSVLLLFLSHGFPHFMHLGDVIYTIFSLQEDRIPYLYTFSQNWTNEGTTALILLYYARPNLCIVPVRFCFLSIPEMFFTPNIVKHFFALVTAVYINSRIIYSFGPGCAELPTSRIFGFPGICETVIAYASSVHPKLNGIFIPVVSSYSTVRVSL